MSRRTEAQSAARYHIMECGQLVATAWTLAEACRLAQEAWDGETVGDGAPSLYDTETGQWIDYDEVAS